METILTRERVPIAQTLAAQELDDFDTLVRQHRSRIFRYILASLRDYDAAETLTQDCFVRAYRARASFRGDSSAGTWLMQIAVNLVRSHVSSRRCSGPCSCCASSRIWICWKSPPLPA